MSKTLILALFAACVLVSALPSEDATPTEKNQKKLVDHKAAQKKVTNLLSQGNDENACSEMAQTSLDEVSTSVQLQQDALDAMDKGAGCQYAGDTIIAQANAKLNQTATAVQIAQDDLNAAKNIDIDLGTYKWDQLNANDCSSLVNIQSYQDATTEVNSAQSTLGEANGALSDAQTGVQNSVQQAADAVTQCKCNVMNEQQEAMEKMNADAEDINTKAWHQAKHIQCVLAGTSAGSCDLGQIPKVEESEFHDSVEGTFCAGLPFKATLGARSGVAASTYDFRLQAVDYPGDGNNFKNANQVGCARLGQGFLPVCDHPSYCKDDGKGWWIGQDHHISHGSHMNTDSYFPSGWSDIKLQFYGHCFYSLNANGGTDLCNNDGSGNGNGYEGTGAPWGSHSWLHPSETQSTGVDGKINAASRFMCAKREHRSYDVSLGSRNGVPARTVRFQMMTAVNPGVGEINHVMVEDCKSIGMKPVCDNPGYCGSDADSIYIGQDHHFAHSPHRREVSYFPEGWQSFVNDYYEETRGICAYTAAANGWGSALCNGYSDSHEWNTAQQRHEWMCAKVIG